MKENSNVIRTKTAIHEAVISLMHEKNIYEISVSELCRKANINRSTFYYHYETPYDCFDELAQSFIQEVVAKFKEYDQPDKDAFYKAFCDTCEKHRTIALALFQMGTQSKYMNTLHECINPFTTGDRLPETMLRFISYGSFGIMYEWLEGRRKDPIKDLNEILDVYEKIYR